jgi:TetR/AcrR family transcriptional regulator of autoinduction and epiphytic fitness
VPPAQRAWVQEMLSAPAAQRVLALGIEHGTAIYERVAVLWPAVSAAAVTDVSVDRYWHGVAARRRGGQRAMVARIAELGGLRPELDVERATDLVVVLVGHDVYRGLVQEAGWNASAYKAWLFTTLVHQLLGTPEADLKATGDLSYGGHVQQ